MVSSLDDFELPRDGVLLAICDVLSEDGEVPEPVGKIDEVAFAVTNGAFEDGPVTPPAVLEDRGRDPVPVGPVRIVEVYGAQDEVTPPTRLEDCPADELTPPETVEDGRYPELHGPTVEEEGVT